MHGVPACAQGDPLGRLRVTPAGVARRDELVWEACRAAGSPVLMLLSGGEQLRCAGRWQACRRQRARRHLTDLLPLSAGYTRASVPCIADSLANLARRFGLFGGAPGGQ